MSNYIKGQDFSLLAGQDADPTVFNTEFSAVATASATKADSLNPTFTGVVTIPALGGIVSHAGDPLKVSPAQSNEIYMHAFPTGTTMTFYQATAPTGWTQLQNAEFDDSILRLVTAASGSVGGVGDGVSDKISLGVSVNSHQLVESEMPSHNHVFDPKIVGTTSATGGSPYSALALPANPTGVGSGATNFTGGNLGHSHTINGRQTWLPRYANFIVCSKD